MTIFHLVLVRAKHDADQETLRKAFSGILAMSEMCLHPTTGKPYIKCSEGGKDNSPEGLQCFYIYQDIDHLGIVQDGLTHAFILEFDNDQDREYYLKTEPNHKKFAASFKGLVDKITIIDFSSGVF